MDDTDKIIAETLRLLNLTLSLEPSKGAALIKEQDNAEHFRSFADTVKALQVKA